MRTIVCIPAFRCEKQIVRVLKGFLNIPNLRDLVQKIVVIDNRSPDRTVAFADEFIKSNGLADLASIVRNEENYGLGGSHKVALKLAHEGRFDHMVILHGDNQATTEEIPHLLKIAHRNPDLSAVLGSRFSIGSRLRGYSKTRIFGNLVLNILYTILTGRWTVDLGSGLNVFKVSDIPLKEIVHCSDSFTFNMDLLLYFYKNGYRIKFVPITWTELDQTSNARNFAVAWTAFKTVLRWRMGQTNKFSRPQEDYRCLQVS